MGYHTDIDGVLKIEPALTGRQLSYLREFHDVRHVRRRVEIAVNRPDEVRMRANLPIGVEGAYAVSLSENSDGAFDYNNPPQGQPHVWCPWTVDLDGESLFVPEGYENPHEYVEWLRWLIGNVFAHWHRKVTGSVTYQGEEPDDFGRITVTHDDQGPIVAVTAGTHEIPDEEALAEEVDNAILRDALIQIAKGGLDAAEAVETARSALSSANVPWE